MSSASVGHVAEGWCPPKAAGTPRGWCRSRSAQDCVWVRTRKYLHIAVYKSLK